MLKRKALARFEFWKKNKTKLFMSDVGLLSSRFPKEDALGIIDGKPAKNMEGVYENFVAQELTAS